MSAKVFAVLGAVLIAGGLVNEMYDIPVRLAQTTVAGILAVGGLCLAAFLAIDEMERR